MLESPKARFWALFSFHSNLYHIHRYPYPCFWHQFPPIFLIVSKCISPAGYHLWTPNAHPASLFEGLKETSKLSKTEPWNFLQQAKHKHHLTPNHRSLPALHISVNNTIIPAAWQVRGSSLTPCISNTSPFSLAFTSHIYILSSYLEGSCCPPWRIAWFYSRPFVNKK